MNATITRLLPVLFTVILPAPWAVLHAAAPLMKKMDLFTAGEGGYQLYRIPGIVVTKSGTVLAYCEARKSDSGDWGPIDVLMRRSTDGGRTWLPRQQVVHLEGDLPINPVAAAQNLDRPGDNTVNNPVAIVDQESGAVHFLYCLEYMRCFTIRSDDDGVTWTEPIEITTTFDAFRPEYDWKVLATGPAHGIQLTTGEFQGRLVVPVWLSLGTGGHAHRPSVTATIFSDDHGRTWRRGDVAVPDTAEFIYPNETVVVQLADGRVMLNSRSESKRHRRLVTIGPDGATGWSQPKFDDALLEPICMAGLVRIRQPDGERPGVLAFSNPHNLSRRGGQEVPGRSRDRVNVSVKLSYDEGRTWPANRTLEEGFSGYSDLAALADGTLLCFYERGSTDGKSIYRTGRLTVARFNESWVRGGDGGDAPAVPPSVGTAPAAASGPSEPDREEGFVCLFNGQTLDGWQGDTAGYEVQEGLLVCTKQGGRLQTVREYGNFVFRFDYKLQPGGNNGIDIRGMEIQILDDDAPKHANLKTCQYHGSIYCRVPAKRGHQKPIGEWNEQEILVDGRHVKVTLNGVVIVDAETDHPALNKPRSPIGFKGHHEHVEFRNLRIRELP